MHISLFEGSGRDPCLCNIQSSPKGDLIGDFHRMIQHKIYKTVEKIFMCVMCCLEQLFKYVSLATLGKGILVIRELLNILLFYISFLIGDYINKC